MTTTDGNAAGTDAPTVRHHHECRDPSGHCAVWLRPRSRTVAGHSRSSVAHSRVREVFRILIFQTFSRCVALGTTRAYTPTPMNCTPHRAPPQSWLSGCFINKLGECRPDEVSPLSAKNTRFSNPSNRDGHHPRRNTAKPQPTSKKLDALRVTAPGETLEPAAISALVRSFRARSPWTARPAKSCPTCRPSVRRHCVSGRTGIARCTSAACSARRRR